MLETNVSSRNPQVRDDEVVGGSSTDAENSLELYCSWFVIRFDDNDAGHGNS